MVIALLGLACRKDSPPAPQSQPASAPATPPVPATVPASQPFDPAAPVRVEIESAQDDQHGWLRIEALYEGAKGGWASAHRPTPSRMVVETENVTQFTIDTSQLELNWSGRVWMVINSYSFELRHKRHPVVHLRETSTGAWDVVEVHDP